MGKGSVEAGWQRPQSLNLHCFNEILAFARMKSADADEIQAGGLDEIKSTHRRSDFTRPKGGFHHRRWFHPPARVDLVEKDSDCITIRVFFWQGHKDLNPEPTVLETRLINQPLGGLLLKLIFQLSKSESPPQSQKPIQKSNKLGISETSLRSSGSTVFYAETVGSESIS